MAPGDNATAYRDLRTITFRFEHGRVYRGDTNTVVNATATSCPQAIVGLNSTAKTVEETVQVGHG